MVLTILPFSYIYFVGTVWFGISLYKPPKYKKYLVGGCHIYEWIDQVVIGHSLGLVVKIPFLVSPQLSYLEKR